MRLDLVGWGAAAVAREVGTSTFRTIYFLDRATSPRSFNFTVLFVVYTGQVKPRGSGYRGPTREILKASRFLSTRSDQTRPDTWIFEDLTA